MKAILLIEDNADILENLTEYFQLEGYIIIATTNGKDGVELARRLIPDLIICDALMPGMDGHKVLQILLGAPETAEIPFIFSTSNSEKVDREEALRMGADEYIVKPFELEVLLRMAESWMKSGRKTHSIESSA